MHIGVEKLELTLQPYGAFPNYAGAVISMNTGSSALAMPCYTVKADVGGGKITHDDETTISYTQTRMCCASRTYRTFCCLSLSPWEQVYATPTCLSIGFIPIQVPKRKFIRQYVVILCHCLFSFEQWCPLSGVVRVVNC